MEAYLHNLWIEEKNKNIALANNLANISNGVEASAPSSTQMSRNNNLVKDNIGLVTKDIELVAKDALAPDYAPDGVEIQGRTSFSTVESLYCHKCGTEKFEPSQQFCHKCGEKFI